MTADAAYRMGLVILAVLIATMVAAHQALSHSWYRNQSDPVSHYGCCGGSDCAPVDPAWVSETPQGFRLNMTLDQARMVNPSATLPIDAVIPWARVQSPPHSHAGESQFHACIYQTDRKPPYGGVICFFATPTM